MDLGGLGHFEFDFNNPRLLRRCVSCPNGPPPCPTCPSDEVCSQISQSCDVCTQTLCIKVGAQPSSAPSNHSAGSTAGAIAGGVIGGIIVVVGLTFLFWRFCIRKRRQQYTQNDWPEASTMEKHDDAFTMQRDARASVHSVRSIASTVLTRASNVIQIAYIPGVTNRSVDSTPDLVPPVPPIPAVSPAGSAATTPHSGQDQHFFMPSDLRDSTYSDYTVDRTSYARSSMAPSLATSMGRGSVPSTAYRASAIVNTVPAQTAIRGKANPVAVAIKSSAKSSPVGTPRSATPPEPIMDRKRNVPRQDSIKTNTTSPIVARLGVPKAVNVTKAQSNSPAAPRAITNASPANSENTQRGLVPLERHASNASRHNAGSSTFDDASSSDEDSPADQSLMGHDKLPQFVKTASLSSKSRNSPSKSFSSAPDLRGSPAMFSSSSTPDSQARHNASKGHRKKQQRSGSLNQIIEEAARRASREPRHGGLGSVGSMLNFQKEHKEGPFSDAHVAESP